MYSRCIEKIGESRTTSEKKEKCSSRKDKNVRSFVKIFQLIRENRTYLFEYQQRKSREEEEKSDENSHQQMIDVHKKQVRFRNENQNENFLFFFLLFLRL